ncbi:MAG: Corrinoid/iron-sulfur protein large subunit [Chloroflexi bacterium]|nr:Corrinoid/iron-sulfur protein large subunit [Chloroflexota bacterium]
MATVFMKWLETSPQNYDRGIWLLTLGRITALKKHIAENYIQPGARVLEIGCGTGTLTALMAEKGAHVTGIDISSAMLAEAERKIAEKGLGDRVTLGQMAALTVGEKYSPGSFDVVAATLVFSEIPPRERLPVLEACHRVLAPTGKLIIVDEVLPHKFLPRLGYRLLHGLVGALTWLLTRTGTTPLRDFENVLAQSGFQTRRTLSYLSDSLCLYEGRPVEKTSQAAPPIPQLSPKVTLITLLSDLWLLFFRIIPPYPKKEPGLYAIGDPGTDSPVLVTGNFTLTVRRVVQAIAGEVDAWLLVADSAGINVWCGAGGGFLTAEKIISTLKTSPLEDLVTHRNLILPQLAANGVDGWKLRTETKWNVRWGPIRAEDIPAYLATGHQKDASMRLVTFPVKDRLEMVTVTLGFYALMILLPVFIFWRTMFWPVTASLLGLSYFYALLHPWLPGKDGLQKSIPLTVIALAGLGLFNLFNPLPTESLINWAIGLTGLSVFSAAELQGMSPLMRGEQANWGWEAVIGVGLGLIYWLVNF